LNVINPFSKAFRIAKSTSDLVFTKDKILVQRTRRGMKRKLVCYLDNEKYYNLNRLSNILITDNEYKLEILYPILNSKLLDFYFNIYFNEYEVKPLHLGQLPIKVNCKNYNELANVGNNISSQNLKLSIELNNFINYVQSKFPIESLSKKLQSWHELEFGDFITELNKAIKKAGGTKLSKMDEMEWMEVFETKKAVVQTLKAEIEKTDREIDQMVYELYGLTDEEIAIVEGSIS